MFLYIRKISTALFHIATKNTCFSKDFNMGKFLGSSFFVVGLLVIALLPIATLACYEEDHESLLINAYEHSCPEAEAIIFAWVGKAVVEDPRMAASLLRLHFHDCFVNGCDASVLLDDTPTSTGEKTAGPNLNSLRGFEVIDAIKSDIEVVCPQTVSCADILAVAARDSVVLSGGPGWDVEMGRRDSLTANKTAANNNIPAPTTDVATLTAKFQKVGLTLNDMVALSGAHTIGKARCSSFSSRLQSSSVSDTPGAADPAFLASLQQLCTETSNSTQTELDLATPETFDNQYFVNLVSGDGLLASDQMLVSHNGATRHLVELYAKEQFSFFDDFRMAMVKMGRINPLLGENGVIRRNCRCSDPVDYGIINKN